MNSELERLIREQRRDDTHRVYPEFNRTVYLDGKQFEFLGTDDAGELVDFRPAKFKRDLWDRIPHGTEGGYTNWKCRCTACRRAGAAAARRRRDERAVRLTADDPRHGRLSTYTNYRCRCERCREAHAESRRSQRAKEGARGNG